MKSSLIVIVLCLTSLGFLLEAASQTTDPVADTNSARLQLEREQAAFNRDIEREKLDVERQKAWLIGIALRVPLIVDALSMACGTWSQYQQAKLQREAQTRNEQPQFELKAAEIALDERDPGGRWVRHAR